MQSQGLVAANNVNPALVGGTDEAQHRLGGWNGEMQEPDANFRERAGPRTSGEGSLTSSAQHNAPEPLPARWLQLLAKLNTEVGPWVMPKDGTVATEPGPPIEHDRVGLALLQSPKQRRWKMLLQRVRRLVISRELRSDEPLRQSWPANDNAPTTRPPNAPGNRPSH